MDAAIDGLNARQDSPLLVVVIAFVDDDNELTHRLRYAATSAPWWFTSTKFVRSAGRFLFAFYWYLDTEVVTGSPGIAPALRRACRVRAAQFLARALDREHPPKFWRPLRSAPSSRRRSLTLERRSVVDATREALAFEHADLDRV